MATKVAVRYSPARSWREDEEPASTNGKKHGVSPATVALAVAGVAAAAGAVYFLVIGERGAKNRDKLKDWMIKAYDQTVQRIEQLKQIDAEHYRRIVDSVLRRYQGVKKGSPDDIGALGRELKEQWDEIKNEVSASKGKYSRLRRISGDEE